MDNLNSRFARMLQPDRHNPQLKGPGVSADAPKSRLMLFPFGKKRDRPRPIVPDADDSDGESVMTEATATTETTSGNAFPLGDDGDFEILRPNIGSTPRPGRSAGLMPFFESLLESERRSSSAPNMKGGRPHFDGVTETTMSRRAPPTNAAKDEDPGDLSQLKVLVQMLESLSKAGGSKLSDILQDGKDDDEDDDSENIDWTPLQYAAQRGSLTLCRAILEKGAAVDALDDKGRTALVMASQNGHADVCRYLLQKGADPNVLTNKGITPLVLASLNGQLGVTEALLSYGADLEARSADNSTPLILAVWKRARSKRADMMDMIRLLLDRGADPNAADDDGDTSLFACAMFQELEIAQLLVNHGARIDLGNKHGKKPIHAAATECDAQMVRFLLDQGANPAEKELHGWNALHLAAQNDKTGTLEVVKMLIDTRVIDINDQQQNGATALYLAVQSKRPDVAQVLLEDGANPNIATRADTRPLQRAVLSSDMELVELLLSHDVDVKTLDKKGRSILHAASAQSDVRILKRVIEAGADALLQQPDSRGGTPLHVAVQNDNEEIALALMEFGATSCK